ncbi:MAG: PfkB family carbohydrate kinase [Ignavibacteriaceae bacterium]
MKKITSFGEILFDVYRGEKTLGGAPFNFIYHIKKLTGSGNFISRIGNDEPGKEVLSLLNCYGISSKYIQIDNKHGTGIASANLDENKIPHWKIGINRAYDFIEPVQDLTGLIQHETECLYFGTLAQRGKQSRNTLRALFGNNIKYFCDLNLRQNFYNADIIKTSLNAANVLKLNEDELKIVNELLLKKQGDESQLAKFLSENYDIDLICVTQGEGGAMLYKDGKTDHYKVEVENVVDTVGAGDAYSAVLCLGYLGKWDISKINKIASGLAAEVVKTEGALLKGNEIYTIFKERIKNG